MLENSYPLQALQALSSALIIAIVLAALCELSGSRDILILAIPATVMGLSIRVVKSAVCQKTDTVTLPAAVRLMFTSVTAKAKVPRCLTRLVSLHKPIVELKAPKWLIRLSSACKACTVPPRPSSSSHMLKLRSCSIWADLSWGTPAMSYRGSQKHRDPHTHSPGTAADAGPDTHSSETAAVSGSDAQSLGTTAASGGGAEATSEAVSESGPDVGNHSAAASVQAQKLTEHVSQAAQVSHS